MTKTQTLEAEDPLAGDVDASVHPDETLRDEELAFVMKYALNPFDDLEDEMADYEADKPPTNVYLQNLEVAILHHAADQGHTAEQAASVKV